MTSAALLAVAHGSRDPRADRVLRGLLSAVRAARPGLDARLAYLENADPSVSGALGRMAAAGVCRVVAVPLLLTSAYHARIDLPGVLARFRTERGEMVVTQAAVLGPDPLLLAAARRRLDEAGVETCGSVVLGAVGTSHPAANAGLGAVAERLGAVAVGFAGGPPRIGDVVGRIRAERGTPVAVASYVLAPGLLPDRFGASGADLVSAPLGDAPEVVELVLRRFDEAARIGSVDDPARARIA